MRRLVRLIANLPLVAVDLPSTVAPLRRRGHRPLDAPARLRLVARRVRRTLERATRHRPSQPALARNAHQAESRSGDPSSPDIQERFHRCMQRLAGFRRCILLGATLLAGLLVAAGLIGWLIGATATEGDPSALSSATITQLAILIGLAATVATVTGFLLASAVFALQFHGQRLGCIAFLLDYVTRREGLVPIATLNLTIVAASVLAAVAGALGCPTLAPGMLVLSLVLVPLSLIATLWVLYRLLTSIAGDVVGACIAPSLCQDLEAAASHDVELPTPLRDLREAMLSSATPLPRDQIRELLGIEAEQKDHAVQAVVTCLERWNRAHTRTRLRRILEADAGPDRLGEIKRAVIERLSDRPCLAGLNAATRDADSESARADAAQDASNGPSVAGRAIRIDCACYANKLALIDVADEPPQSFERAGRLQDDIANRLVHELAKKLDPELAKLIIDHAPSMAHVENLDDLHDALLRAMGDLSSHGHQPGVILLPKRGDVVGAALHLDAERPEDAQRLGPDHLGRWRRCEVFRWPAETDALSIVVLDANAFCKPIRPLTPNDLALDWEDPDAEQHDAWLQAVRAGDDLPDALGEIELIVRARLAVPIDLGEASAAARIDIPPRAPSQHPTL